MISAEGVGHAFSGHEVLRDVSIFAGAAEVVGLIGPNGSGKTTLLRMLYRALTPDQGEVAVAGEPADRIHRRELARRVAVVVQDEPTELTVSAWDMVMLGRNPHLRAWQRHSPRDVEITAAALRRVDAEHLAARDVSTLSGGERQRVLIARALAQQATHLLMDEPTNHLDIHFQHQVLSLVRRLGVTTIIVLHDINLAARYCDRLVLLDQGRIIVTGTVDEVLRPEVLEPVYDIRIQRVIAEDQQVQLLFGPFPPDPSNRWHLRRERSLPGRSVN